MIDMKLAGHMPLRGIKCMALKLLHIWMLNSILVNVTMCWSFLRYWIDTHKQLMKYGSFSFKLWKAIVTVWCMQKFRAYTEHRPCNKDVNKISQMSRSIKQYFLHLPNFTIFIAFPVCSTLVKEREDISRCLYLRITSEDHKSSRPRPIFCLLLRISPICAQPITWQVTSVAWPVIGWAYYDLTLSKRQKTVLGLAKRLFLDHVSIYYKATLLDISKPCHNV